MITYFRQNFSDDMTMADCAKDDTCPKVWYNEKGILDFKKNSISVTSDEM